MRFLVGPVFSLDHLLNLFASSSSRCFRVWGRWSDKLLLGLLIFELELSALDSLAHFPHYRSAILAQQPFHFGLSLKPSFPEPSQQFE